jgi:hypothetical protein
MGQRDGPTVLYTFAFEGFPLDKSYKYVTGTVAGVHIEETRTFPRAKLDEDPGFDWSGGPAPIPMRRKDEFRARVTVSQVTQEFSAVQSIYA